MPDPSLFIIEARSDNKYPTASVGREYLRLQCGECGRTIGKERDLEEYELFCVSGAGWPDIMEERHSHRILLAERIVNSLHKAGISCFKVRLTRIGRMDSKKLTRRGAPRYFLPVMPSGIRVDLEASGIRHAPVLCETCGSQGELPGSALVPFTRQKRRGLKTIPESWTGADLFICEDLGSTSYTFCTRRVLELARAERWTGVRFDPIDAPFDLRTRWRGIDFRGKQWPPKAWYPPPPDAGKSPEEWVSLLVEFGLGLAPLRLGELEGAAAGAEANFALLWIGPPALTLLTPLLGHGTPFVRRLAAWLIMSIAERDEVQLPTDVAAKALEMTPRRDIGSLTLAPTWPR